MRATLLQHLIDLPRSSQTAWHLLVQWHSCPSIKFLQHPLTVDVQYPSTASAYMCKQYPLTIRWTFAGHQQGRELPQRLVSVTISYWPFHQFRASQIQSAKQICWLLQFHCTIDCAQNMNYKVQFNSIVTATRWVVWDYKSPLWIALKMWNRNCKNVQYSTLSALITTD